MQFDAVGCRAVFGGGHGHGMRRIAHAVAAARAVLQNKFDKLPRMKLQGRASGQLQHHALDIGSQGFDGEHAHGQLFHGEGVAVGDLFIL